MKAGSVEHGRSLPKKKKPRPSAPGLRFHGKAGGSVHRWDIGDIVKLIEAAEAA
jgi:hypothetical protein